MEKKLVNDTYINGGFIINKNIEKLIKSKKHHWNLMYYQNWLN